MKPITLLWPIRIIDLIKSIPFTSKKKYSQYEDTLVQKINRIIGKDTTVLLESGQSALKLALKVLSLKEGAAVGIPALACSSVLYPVVQCNLKPVILDMNSQLEVDINNLKEQIEKLDAMIIVYFGGKSIINKETIKLCRSKKIKIIHDLCQGFGLSQDDQEIFGQNDLYIYSFGLGKVTNGLSGGALAFNKQEEFDKLIIDEYKQKLNQDFSLKKLIYFFKLSILTRILWKIVFKRRYDNIGEYHLIEIDRIKEIEQNRSLSIYEIKFILNSIKDLDWNIKKRKAIADIYHNELKSNNMIHIISEDKESDNIFCKYWILVEDAQKICRQAGNMGIELELIHAPLDLRIDQTNCTDAYKLWNKIIGLPISPYMNKKDALYVANAINQLTMKGM